MTFIAKKPAAPFRCTRSTCEVPPVPSAPLKLKSSRPNVSPAREALSALVVNKMRGVLDVVAIKAPGFGDRRKALLQDLAIATGATYVAKEVGISIEKATPEMLGTCERIIVGIVSGRGQRVPQRARVDD